MSKRGLQAIVVLGGSIVVALGVTARVTVGHKMITSKYKYNEHVYPIFRQHCGSCHIDGGPAPMSLLTHKDAEPWAEAIREEVLQARMPPWYAEDGFGAFKHPLTLTAKEVDTILVWTTGGAPEGSELLRPEPAAIVPQWTLGPPGLTLKMPAAFELGEDQKEQTHEVVIPTSLAQDRWVKAIDLMPGTPAIVRRASVYLSSVPTKAGSTAGAGGPLDSPLAIWVPGLVPVKLADSAAFRLPAQSKLLLRIQYRKTWKYEGSKMTDQSTIGLYFADRPGEPVGNMAVSSPRLSVPANPKDYKVTFSRTIDRDLRALALRPETAPPNVSMQVEAVRPDGTRQPLLRLARSRPDWERRYWFDTPVSLTKGSRLEVTAIFGEPTEAIATGGATPSADAVPLPDVLRLWMDFVPETPRRSAR